MDELTHLMATRPWCFTIVETQDPKEHGGYVPSVVIENDPGHRPLLGNGRGATPWIWGQTLAEAQQTCQEANAKRGISEEEAFRIVASTFKR